MIFFDIANALFLAVISFECFRILQSCSYRPLRGYFKIFATLYFLILAVTQAVILLFYFFLPKWAMSIVFLSTAILTCFAKRKCPLKFTKRIVRLLIAQTLLLIVLCCFALYYLCVVILPLVTLLSLVLLLPIDKSISAYYVKKAVAKLSSSGVTVVAVTGSYGKTTTKDMLSTLLCDSIAPSGSFNTPLGIAKFINETNLASFKYLILEFGARNVGDIKQLSQLFAPRYGIITGLCEQHLSTFKSFQNILQAKGELLDFLPSDAVCILNGNDGNTQLLNNRGYCKKLYAYADCVTKSETTLHGSTFTFEKDAKSYNVSIPQISSYAMQTFLICLELCNVVGQHIERTLKNAKKIKQTAHRMQVTYNGNFYIVDDSYNGNLKGVESCAKTLAQFDNYKIAVTQGIVEGGKCQNALNCHCGRFLGQICDVVIAVGKYSQQIFTGATGLKCLVLRAKNLQHAMELLPRYAKKNCIVLFQNDLPDVVNL